MLLKVEPTNWNKLVQPRVYELRKPEHMSVGAINLKTGIYKATQRINPRLGFYCAKYTNPNNCMYKKAVVHLGYCMQY